MSNILLVEKSGPIVTLTLNRPEKLNALNQELITSLFAAFDEIGRDSQLRCAILTGSGEKAFAAGADIEAMSSMTPIQAKAFADMGHAVGSRMESLHFPVIGAINGFALGGGCELALACDFLYASETAKFGQPEVNLAVIPGFGGTQRLARRVGIARARELCYTGDMLSAADALSLGLVNGVTPLVDLLPKVRSVAEKIAAKGPLAISQCKRVILRGEDVSSIVALELEAQAFSSLFGSADQREGMKAFIEKRKPTFRGE